MMKPESPRDRFACLVQQFFLERLIRQRNASQQTVAAYRDAFRLLLAFGEEHRGKPAESFTLAELDADFVLAFLDHLETQRHNTVRSRNARLAAIRSFLRFASLHEPMALPAIQRVLAIPLKRYDKPLLGYLTREEIQAVLNAPDATTWQGRRDRVLLTTLYNTGARVSEVARIAVSDVIVEGNTSIRIHGKGRKERLVPLWRTTAQQIRRWLPQVNTEQEKPLFPSRFGTALTRSAITERLQRAVRSASVTCPQLAGRRVSPHTLRHSTAMHMLQAGVDITVIALWLGHESPSTTHIYIEADLTMKEKALKAVTPPEARAVRYRPPGKLLRFLQSL